MATSCTGAPARYWDDLPLTTVPRSRDLRTLAERARTSSRFLGERWGAGDDDGASA